MARRARVPLVSAAGTSFTVAAGAACVDFVYTGVFADRAETVLAPADFARWAAEAGLIADAFASEISEADLAAALELRETLWSSLNRVCDGGYPSDHECRVLNRLAAKPDLVPALRIGLHGSMSVDDGGPITGSQLLSALARDAIALFAGPYARRIKRCAADDCGLLFVDTSRPGARRWCAMSRCGNRDKARTRRRTQGQRK